MDSGSSENARVNNPPTIDPSGQDQFEIQILDRTGSNPNVLTQLESSTIGMNATNRHTTAGTNVLNSSGVTTYHFPLRVWVRPSYTSGNPSVAIGNTTQSSTPPITLGGSGRSANDLAEIPQMLTSLVERTQSRKPRLELCRPGSTNRKEISQLDWKRSLDLKRSNSAPLH